MTINPEGTQNQTRKQPGNITIVKAKVRVITLGVMR